MVLTAMLIMLSPSVADGYMMQTKSSAYPYLKGDLITVSQLQHTTLHFYLFIRGGFSNIKEIISTGLTGYVVLKKHEGVEELMKKPTLNNWRGTYMHTYI